MNPSNPTNTVDTLNNLSLKHQVMLIYGMKGMYEDLLKKKDYKAIEDMKHALAFTGPDGINPLADQNDGMPAYGNNKKDMLSVMLMMLANVRKAVAQ